MSTEMLSWRACCNRWGALQYVRSGQTGAYEAPCSAHDVGHPPPPAVQCDIARSEWGNRRGATPRHHHSAHTGGRSHQYVDQQTPLGTASSPLFPGISLASPQHLAMICQACPLHLRLSPTALPTTTFPYDSTSTRPPPAPCAHCRVRLAVLFAAEALGSSPPSLLLAAAYGHAIRTPQPRLSPLPLRQHIRTATRTRPLHDRTFTLPPSARPSISKTCTEQ